MSTMKIPGFNAEASLSPATAVGNHQGGVIRGGSSATNIGAVMPQFSFRFGGDPDIGDYLRCRANGGGDLVCRFFGGLPPFNIGLLRFS
jgi:hypothetical protein